MGIHGYLSCGSQEPVKPTKSLKWNGLSVAGYHELERRAGAYEAAL
jgi:hypothetical protein